MSDLTTSMQVFLVGCAGSSAGEIVHWWSLARTKRNFPAYAKSAFYWALTFAMILLGGFICWIQFGGSGRAWIVFQIGVAAPLILQKLTNTLPKTEGAMGSRPSWRDFFYW